MFGLITGGQRLCSQWDLEIFQPQQHNKLAAWY